MNDSPRILVYDIETSPIESYTWGLFNQNVSLGQIKKDWNILAWAAKWYGDPENKVMYMDNRGKKNIHDDKALVRGIATLLNKADICITQNGERFDRKKINARAIINGLSPIKPCMSTDILKEGRKVFGFTSHKLEYVSHNINDKYKKLSHGKYPGFSLWSAILAGDKSAWKEMETYTKHDVLATEEAYSKMAPWIKTHAMSVASDDSVVRCKCGSGNLMKKGYAWSEAGKYQIYMCKDCGKWPRSGINLLTANKRAAMLRDLKGRG